MRFLPALEGVGSVAEPATHEATQRGWEVGSDGDVLRRCRSLVHRFERSVAVPSPFDLALFLQRWIAHRGRPVELLPLAVAEMPAGAGGLWLAFADHDVIAFPADAPPNHRDHIVLHEVGHILAGHGGSAAAAPSTSGLIGLLPDLQPEMVRAVLGRSCGSGTQEQEAELIASLLLLNRPGRVRPGPQHPVAARIERAFGSASGGEPADDR
jgi:hypothetical protein